MNEIEKAIECLKTQKDNLGMVVSEEVCNLAISSLENQLTNGWIPVNVSLPDVDKSRSYLVTKKSVDSEEGKTYNEACTEIFWVSDCKWDCERDELCDWKVVAWQTLPEPYKEP
jgi:hypothetical protein